MSFSGVSEISKPEIVFEDEWLIAVNKPPGLSVHANPGDAPGVLNLQDLMSEGFRRRLVLFHRLDKDTSGLVLLGKRPEIGEAMSRLFEEKRIRKAYYAVVVGRWNKAVSRVENSLERGANGRMQIVEPPDGKRALTTFRVLREGVDRTWLEAMPKTGRTHQIRVHCASVGCAILGDRLYGTFVEGAAGLALHAHRVNFPHPISGAALQISAAPPSAWTETWLQGLKPLEERGKK